MFTNISCHIPRWLWATGSECKWWTVVHEKDKWIYILYELRKRIVVILWKRIVVIRIYFLTDYKQDIVKCKFVLMMAKSFDSTLESELMKINFTSKEPISLPGKGFWFLIEFYGLKKIDILWKYAIRFICWFELIMASYFIEIGSLDNYYTRIFIDLHI